MNINSSLTPSQAQDTSPIGAGARKDYAISITKKVEDQIKQEGPSIIQLTDIQPVATAPDKALGTLLDVKA